MRAFLIALAACLILAAPASAQSTTLVINEVDYDQPGTDTAEFVEIKNVSVAAINLDAYQLRFVNGAERNDLPDRRPAGRRASPAATTSSSAANARPTPNCDLDVAPDTNLIQNGARTASVLETAAAGRSASAMPAATRWPASLRARTRPADGRQQRRRGRWRALPDGCDTDNNANDFERAAITPGASNGGTRVRRPAGRRRAVRHRHDVPATAPPTSRSPATSRSRSASRSTSPPARSRIACSDSGAHPATLSGGPTTFTLNPDADFARNETCTVTVSAAGVTDQDADDPPNNLAGDFTFSFSTLGLAGLRIHDIQAAQHISPHDGDFVVGVPGIVTAGPWQRLLLPGPDGGQGPGDVRGHLRVHRVGGGQAGGRPGDHGHRPRRRVPARRRGQRRT